jgi:uncharacterized coiled-coil DUF342 family protein
MPDGWKSIVRELLAALDEQAEEIERLRERERELMLGILKMRELFDGPGCDFYSWQRVYQDIEGLIEEIAALKERDEQDAEIKRLRNALSQSIENTKVNLDTIGTLRKANERLRAVVDAARDVVFMVSKIPEYTTDKPYVSIQMSKVDRLRDILAALDKEAT